MTCYPRAMSWVGAFLFFSPPFLLSAILVHVGVDPLIALGFGYALMAMIVVGIASNGGVLGE